MKKVLYIMLFLVLGMSLTAQSVWDGKREAISSGSGTESDPYLIENAQQLAWLVYSINWDYARWTSDKYFLLTTDIELNGSTDNQWIPIGAGPTIAGQKYFKGVFDGGFHKITGLYIDNDNPISDKNSLWDNNYASFFSTLDPNISVIKNLYLEGSVTSDKNSSGLAGSGGTIDYCVMNVDVETTNTSNTGAASGFVTTNATITNSANLGEIKGNNAGGFVCTLKADIENCYNMGNITAEARGGGIMAFANNNGTMKNCYNVGTISAEMAGGISGTGGQVDNCYYIDSSVENPNALGEPKSAEFMHSQEFVNLLNNGTNCWVYDTDNTNDGYPVFGDSHFDVFENFIENTDLVVVYPNPVIDNVYVVGDVVSCEMYDLVGKHIKTISENMDKICVTDLSSGIYMIRFFMKNGSVVTKKIMKK